MNVVKAYSKVLCLSPTVPQTHYFCPVIRNTRGGKTFLENNSIVTRPFFSVQKQQAFRTFQLQALKNAIWSALALVDLLNIAISLPVSLLNTIPASTTSSRDVMISLTFQFHSLHATGLLITKVVLVIFQTWHSRIHYMCDKYIQNFKHSVKKTTGTH